MNGGAGGGPQLDEVIGTQLAALRHVRPGIQAVIAARAAGQDRIAGVGADADTIFEIGSVTKVFTATLLAAACAARKLALDEPVANGVPELGALPEWLTLERLATHTAGLPRLPGNLWKTWLWHPRDPYAGYRARHLIAFLRSWTPPAAPPGRDSTLYSNLGYELLTLALERRLGGSYAELLRRWVTGPLGLDSTTAGAEGGGRMRFAAPKNSLGLPTPAWRFPELGGAGSIRSTAADLLRFLAAQLVAPAGVLGAALTFTQEPRVELPPRRGVPVVMGGGLGWMTQGYPGTGRMIHWHNGATYGSQSFVAFERAAGTAVVVLMARGRGVLDVVVKAPTGDAIGSAVLRAMSASTAGSSDS